MHVKLGSEHFATEGHDVCARFELLTAVKIKSRICQEMNVARSSETLVSYHNTSRRQKTST